MSNATPNIDQGDRPLEDYSLPILWQRIAELEAQKSAAYKEVEIQCRKAVEAQARLDAVAKTLRSAMNESEKEPDATQAIGALECAVRLSLEALGGDDE